jgi:hypothetical protein
MNRCIPCFLLLSVIAAGALAAQEAERGPDGGTTYHVTGVELLPISGEPFSAHSRTDWTRALEGGGTVKVHLEANLARDSQGRMYRERRSFVPEGSNQQPRLNEIQIFDPIQHTQTICTVATHHCILSNYHPRMSFTPLPPGPLAGGTRFLTRENIGTNTIENLDVIGTRETITTSAGVVGNQEPLVSTREFWYASELQTNLAITRKDPREGTQVVQLSNISLSEPAAEFFQVPEGYTVSDARAPVAQPQPQR